MAAVKARAPLDAKVDFLLLFLQRMKFKAVSIKVGEEYRYELGEVDLSVIDTFIPRHEYVFEVFLRIVEADNVSLMEMFLGDLDSWAGFTYNMLAITVEKICSVEMFNYLRCKFPFERVFIDAMYYCPDKISPTLLRACCSDLYHKRLNARIMMCLICNNKGKLLDALREWSEGAFICELWLEEFSKYELFRSIPDETFDIICELIDPVELPVWMLDKYNKPPNGKGWLKQVEKLEIAEQEYSEQRELGLSSN